MLSDTLHTGSDTGIGGVVIRSKPSNDRYRSEWDRIFGKKCRDLRKKSKKYLDFKAKREKNIGK